MQINTDLCGHLLKQGGVARHESVVVLLQVALLKGRGRELRAANGKYVQINILEVA